MEPLLPESYHHQERMAHRAEVDKVTPHDRPRDEPRTLPKRLVVEDGWIWQGMGKALRNPEARQKQEVRHRRTLWLYLD